MELKKYIMKLNTWFYADVRLEPEESSDGEWYRVEDVQAIFLVKENQIENLREELANLLAVIPELQRVKKGYSKDIK